MRNKSSNIIFILKDLYKLFTIHSQNWADLTLTKPRNAYILEQRKYPIRIHNKAESVIASHWQAYLCMCADRRLSENLLYGVQLLVEFCSSDPLLKICTNCKANKLLIYYLLNYNCSASFGFWPVSWPCMPPVRAPYPRETSF